MALSNIDLLLISNFFHYFSNGLLAPVLTPHITANGGNHVILGFLIAILFMCEKSSRGFLKTLQNGNKFALNFCLYSTFFSNLLLVANYNCWLICLTRCFTALTNQVNFYSKKYLRRQSKISESLLDSSRIFGIVFGAISSGYIWDKFENFSIIAMLASICSFLGIIFLQYIDEDEEESNSKITQKSVVWKNLNFGTHWDKLLLQSALTFSYTIYSTRFAFLVVSNHQVGIVIVGYTVAYQCMLEFATKSTIPLLIPKIQNKNQFFEYSLVFYGFAICGLYYAPSYELYLILYILMICSHTIINVFLHEILGFKNENEIQTANYLNDLVQVSSTILFGAALQTFGVGAFKLLAVFPSICSFYLIRKRLFVESSKVKKLQ